MPLNNLLCGWFNTGPIRVTVTPHPEHVSRRLHEVPRILLTKGPEEMQIQYRLVNNAFNKGKDPDES